MTPSSTPLSSPSASFRRTEPLPLRLAWRPSRLLQGMLALIGICGCVALWMSELPTPVASVATPLVMIAGAHLIRRERRTRHRDFVVDATGVARLDGQRLDTPRLHWRGPIAFLSWREGRRTRRLVWWPDILPPAARRELRLAASAFVTRPSTGSMAP